MLNTKTVVKSAMNEFDTMEEYRADLKKKIEERKAADAKAKKEDAVIEKIIEAAQMEIPEAMIETQAENLVDAGNVPGAVCTVHRIYRGVHDQSDEASGKEAH